MPTGFDKFSKRALEEQPITINSRKAEPAPEVPVRTPEEKPAAKMSRAVRIEEAKPAEPAAKKEAKETEKKELFPLTIQIEMTTKRKLDELKFTQQKKLKELAEEAFEDLYRKYKG